MKAKIRDTEIFFDIDGVGLKAEPDRMVERPVAFLIHGGPGADHTGYKRSMSALTDRMQLVYFDHRGQGRSARNDPETYDMNNYVEDMEGLRQHLGLDKIVVIGASFGGMVALAYTVRYPQHVSHLIAIVTTPSFAYVARAREIVAERGTAEQQEVVRRGLDGEFVDEEDMRYFFQVMGPMYSLRFNPEEAKAARNRGIVSPETSNAWLKKHVFNYDVTDQLPSINVPTLVVGARHDWICAPEFSELIASKIPNADLRMFENSGHSVMSDESDALLDVIRGFLPYQSR